MPRSDAAVAYLEIVINDANIGIGCISQPVLKYLNQQFIQLAERLHPTVIDLHELFHCEGVAIDHPPHCRKLFLVIEEQSVVSAPRHVVQCESHLAEKLLAIPQLVALGLAQKVRLVDVAKALTEASERDPLYDLQVSKTAGRTLDVGLQSIFGIAVAVVAILLLAQLAANKVIGRPHGGGVDGRCQRFDQGGVACEMACFQHCRHYSQVLFCQLFALG